MRKDMGDFQFAAHGEKKSKNPTLLDTKKSDRKCNRSDE